MKQGDGLLTVREAAACLRVPVSWVYAKAAEGVLPSYKLGRYVRFREDEITAYVNEQRQGAIARRHGGGEA